MSNQSGTESPQPSKGHTPDGSNGASQLGQGSSECVICEGQLDRFEQQILEYEEADRERAAADQACFDFAARYREARRVFWDSPEVARICDPTEWMTVGIKLSRTPETD
jgi:hypothetical protein